TAQVTTSEPRKPLGDGAAALPAQGVDASTGIVLQPPSRGSQRTQGRRIRAALKEVERATERMAQDQPQRRAQAYGGTVILQVVDRDPARDVDVRSDGPRHRLHSRASDR